MNHSVGIMGLGYVGLPLAVQAAEKGMTVIGVDPNQELVNDVNRRETSFVNDNRFNIALRSLEPGSMEATTDYTALADVESILVCVPTPTEYNQPDLSHVLTAAKQIGRILKCGQLISLESTVNPGVTRKEVLPVIEHLSGLVPGSSFNLVYCPERVDPGNPLYHVGNLNRVIGGITDNCLAKGVTLYSEIIDAEIVPLGSVEEAEFVKSWENTQRNIQIATANYAAMICDAMGMDFSRIQAGLQSKIDQFGLKLAHPGIGPGGHCIPEDIHYVIKNARHHGLDTRFLDNSAEVNEGMPEYAVQELSKLIKAHGESMHDQTVAVLGLAYKPNTDDTRRSPATEVMHELARRSKAVVVHDPHVKDIKKHVGTFRIANSLDEALSGADAVFIATAHDVYLHSLNPQLLREYGVRYVLDGRNCLVKSDIVNAGIAYKGIGQ